MKKLTQVLALRLSPELRMKLDTIAEADQRKPSAMLRVLIHQEWEAKFAGHSEEQVFRKDKQYGS